MKAFSFRASMPTLRAAVFLLLPLVLPPRAHGQTGQTATPTDLTSVNIFSNVQYQQTSSTPPTTPAGYFFEIGGNFTDVGDFNTAAATYPGPGSPVNVPITGTALSSSSPVVTSLSTFHTDFPLGTYTITATNTVASFSHSGVISYTAMRSQPPFPL